MATARPDYYCHKCQVHIGHITNFECPRCRDSFIEEISSQRSSSHSRSGRPHSGRRVQYHGSTPFGNTTIYIGGNHPSNHDDDQHDNQPDLGTFFQTVLAQFAGGLTGGGSQHPFVMHNGGGAQFQGRTNLDTFLTHLLNQMGENSGPAPASENRITSIPTVNINREQARDSLQCAICMDDFKENEQAKRLPCSHYFHEECILRWLRMHGTCPTCRVTLDDDNTNNREYYNQYPNQERSSSTRNNNNNNRRNDGGNNGSSSLPGSTLYQFD